MQVIICGAGQVGYNIARYLATENADITVIDQSPELVEKISESLDVKGLVGFASHPDVLERAGAADADMVIAVTYADEVNMVACQICHSIFEVPTKIARIRHQSYLDPMWSDLFGRENAGGGGRQGDRAAAAGSRRLRSPSPGRWQGQPDRRSLHR
jgi:trk system potassium uptake protein TrkA